MFYFLAERAGEYIFLFTFISLLPRKTRLKTVKNKFNYVRCISLLTETPISYNERKRLLDSMVEH